MKRKNSSPYIVGIITARGGSVRLPLKNIRLLAGKPLIAYIITAAIQSRYLNRVIVSTDHPGIKKISLQYGAEVPFKRPKNLSGNCSSVLVTQHAVRFIEREEERKVDIVVTLQPTTPFCQTRDIDICIEKLMKNSGIQSVFSAREVKEHPEWMFRVKNQGRVQLYLPGRMKGRRIVRRYLERMVIPNGAIYVIKREVLFGQNVLISDRAAAYIMKRDSSVDIDDEIDFRFAEFLLKRRRM